MPMPKPAGSEFIVYSNASFASGSSFVAGHADGSYYVVWEQLTEPMEEDNHFTIDIFGRGYSLTGALSAAKIVNTEREDPQIMPTVTARPDGGYVVAYRSGEENHLEGMFAGTRLISAAGLPTGVEQLGDYTYYHNDPEVAVQADGSFLAVSSDEFDISARFQSATGAILSEENVGNTDFAGSQAVTTLPGGRYLIVWNGYSGENDPPADDEPFGIYGQIWGADGVADAVPFLIAQTASWRADITAETLADGRVAVLWDPTQFADDVPVLAVIDPDVPVAVVPVQVAPLAATRPEMALLPNGDIVIVYQQGDGNGSGIWGRVMHDDGTFDAPFLVNNIVAGSQVDPSVAATGTDRFVVSWTGPDGIHARIFGGPDSPLFTRAGTIDLSPAANQTVSGVAAANSFYVDLAADSGVDRILNFGRTDLLLTSDPIVDVDGDGFIWPSRGGIAVDAPGISDLVRIDGLDGGLRYLGESGNVSVYATGGVRPTGALEGKLGRDTLTGDRGDLVGQIFFRDTALGIEQGDDTIRLFGAKDIFVTTSKLADSDGDGIIGFGSDKLLDIGKDALMFTNLSGGRITKLEYDGMVADNGSNYYVYSLVGSAASVGDLIL